MKRKLLRPIAIVLMTALALSLTVIPLTGTAAEDKLPPWMNNPGFDLVVNEYATGESAVWVYNYTETDTEGNQYTYREFYFVNGHNITGLVLDFGASIDSANIGTDTKNVYSAVVSGTELAIMLKDMNSYTADTYKGPETRLPVVVGGETYYLAFHNFAGLFIPADALNAVNVTVAGRNPATNAAGNLYVQGTEAGKVFDITFTPKANYEILGVKLDGVAFEPEAGGTYLIDNLDTELYKVEVDYIYNAPTSSTPAAPPAPSMPWTDPEPNTPDSFLASLYFAALGRTPDEGGFDDWADALESGAMTATDVVYGFVFSPEMVNKNLSDEEYVIMLYAAFFARDPDEGGKAHWLGRLASGATRYDVFLGFANSVEFDVFCDAHGFVRV
ncbi:MAG: DUF4214 domain-containing protein [Oscillospiraceae bacterium]|nr:DUF4214 domain-containing protein [Oscillospiraceae bacterium]